VEYDWCRLFKGQCFFSNLSSSSAGVAFLFRPGLVPESCHFQEVIKGRFISLELVINNFHFTLFNVYAPSESVERRAFFLSLIRHFRSIDLNDCICMGGDFNCTLEPLLDRNTAEPHPESYADLSNFFSAIGLLDAWRLCHPNESQYTWGRWANGRASFARLDRWYINSHFRTAVFSPVHFPSLFSDHHLVTMGLFFPQPSYKSAYWKFNTNLLEDTSFKKTFYTFWAIQLSKKASFSSLELWWDNTKACFKCYQC